MICCKLVIDLKSGENNTGNALTTLRAAENFLPVLAKFYNFYNCLAVHGLNNTCG
jgi:hypothetical protein